LFKRYLHPLGVFSFAIGVGIFIYLIRQTGLSVILANFRLFGWYFLLIFLISGFRYCLRTLAWRLSMTPEKPAISLTRLFSIRLIGETANDLTFAGPAFGEPVKVLAASRFLPTTLALSSIVIENLAFSLSVVFFLAAGMLALVLKVEIPSEIRMAGLIASCLLILPALLVYWAILRRWKLASELVGKLKKKFPRWDCRGEFLEKVQKFEERIYGFASTHPNVFMLILALELMTHLGGVLEAWLILRAITGQPGFLSAFLIESSYRIVNIAFAFVPLRLGVDESGTALTLQALGWSTGIGVTLALIRKIRIFAWMAIGLLLAGQSLGLGLWRGTSPKK
jgi:hypothetical protein